MMESSSIEVAIMLKKKRTDMKLGSGKRSCLGLPPLRLQNQLEGWHLHLALCIRSFTPRTTTPRSRQRWTLRKYQGWASSYRLMRRNFKIRRSLLLGRPDKFGEIVARSHRCKEDVEENRVVAPFMSRGVDRAMVELNEGLAIAEAVAFGSPDQVVMPIFF